MNRKAPSPDPRFPKPEPPPAPPPRVARTDDWLFGWSMYFSYVLLTLFIGMFFSWELSSYFAAALVGFTYNDLVRWRRTSSS